MQTIFRELMKQMIILQTSDAWLMNLLSQRPSKPTHYIEDCRIATEFAVCNLHWLGKSSVDVCSWSFSLIVIRVTKYVGALVHKIHNPTIYNIIPWFAQPMGQTTRQPSGWRSKYFFSLFLIDLGHSKHFHFTLEFYKKVENE